MDVLVAGFTDWKLFAVDSCQEESKPGDSLTPLADVPDVVHLDRTTAATDSAVVQQPGACASGIPGGLNVYIIGCFPGRFHLLQGLVEEVYLASVGFLIGQVLTVLTEDFPDR